MMDDMAAASDAPSRHHTDTVMRATDLRAAVETRIDATSSNVLYRTEPPVTASRCIAVRVRVRPDNSASDGPSDSEKGAAKQQQKKK